jgi:hypothetical protein
MPIAAWPRGPLHNIELAEAGRFGEMDTIGPT